MKTKFLNAAPRVYRALILLLVLTLAWGGFIWLVQAPPVDAIPALLMVWTTAIVLLLAFFPSVLDSLRKIKVGDVEFEMRETVASSTTHDFISVSDLASAYQATSRGDVAGLQAILARAIQQPGKPVLAVIDLQAREITLAFLFSYLFLVDMLSGRVIVVFAAPAKSAQTPADLNIADILGALSGKKLLLAYYRRFPSLMNLFIHNSEIKTVLEPVGLTQTPSGELIMRLYEQCRAQISLDMEKEKDGALASLDGGLSRGAVERWLGDALDQHVIDARLGESALATLRECLTQQRDFLLVSENGGLKSILALDDFSRVIARKALSQIP